MKVSKSICCILLLPCNTLGDLLTRDLAGNTHLAHYQLEIWGLLEAWFVYGSLSKW